MARRRRKLLRLRNPARSPRFGQDALDSVRTISLVVFYLIVAVVALAIVGVALTAVWWAFRVLTAALGI